MDRNTKIQCKAYLDWVRTKPCCACGSPSVDAHHVKARGAGNGKQNDFLAVPLCRFHHSELHQMGTRALANAGTDVWQEAAWLIIEFLVYQKAAERDPVQYTVGKEIRVL